MNVQVYAGSTLVYDPNLPELGLLQLRAKQSIKVAGTASLLMPAGHPAYNAFTEYRTLVTIYRAGDLIFRGRALNTSCDFYNTRTVTCEGERCFLRDGILEPYLYQAAPAVIFSDIIRRYNAQVDDFKQFEVGAVTVTDPNGYIRLESETAETVATVIDKLVQRVGGYIIFTTNAAGRRVINWLADLPGRNERPIEFEEDLLDLVRTTANPDFATIIWPYGAKDETTGQRVTIEAVNGGKRYVIDEKVADLRGRVARPVYWDDVTLASNLKAKALQHLETSKQIYSSMTVTAKAADISGQRVGYYTRVLSLPHGLDDWLPLFERDYNLLDDTQDKIQLGRETVTLTGGDVSGDKDAQIQLRRAEQALKTDYQISLTDAVARLAKK